MAGTVVEELVALLGYEIEGTEKLDKFNKGLEKVADVAANVSMAIGVAFAAVGAAVAGGMGTLATSVIGTSAEFETYLTTLETIEGSADKAKKSFDWITNFAATTPYEVDELTRSFVKLRSYGLDPMDGSITVLGDTASAMGKTLDQAVEAFADAATMQFERLKEFGITSAQKGNQVTFSWDQNGKTMTKSVKKTSQEVRKFLTETWGSKFNGAMLKQSKTWKGMLSNMGDMWTMFKYRIGDSGFFDTVKNRLGDMLDVFNRWMTDGRATAVAQAFSDIFSSIANAVGSFAQQTAAHIEFLGKHWDKIKGWVKVLAAVALGVAIFMAPWLAILGVIGLAIDDVLTYLEGGDSLIGRFIDTLKGWANAANEFVEGIRNKLINLGQSIYDGLVNVASWGAGIGQAITDWIWNSIKSAWDALAFPELGQGIYNDLSNVAQWASGIGQSITDWIWGNIKSAWEALNFASLGQIIVDGIMSGLRDAGSKITGWFNDILPDWVKSGLNIPVNFQSNGGPNLQIQSNAGSANPNGGQSLKTSFDNFANNMGKTGAGSSGAAIVQDQSTKTQNTTVNAPVTVNVQQASQVPAKVGNHISSTINSAANRMPSRFQDSEVK